MLLSTKLLIVSNFSNRIILLLYILCGNTFQDTLKMNIQSAISREIFIPSDEKLLVAIEVRRRIRRKLSFLKAGLKKDYLTFLCLSGNVSFNEE